MSQLVDTGKGVAEFPDEMSHDDIAGVIKNQFYSPENPPPAEIKPTGGRAENAIAQMDQAPTYPSKTNADQATVNVAGQDNEPFVSPQIATAAGRGSAAVMTGGLSEALLNAFPQSAPAKIAKGGLESYGDILSGFTTPTNLALLGAGGPLAKLGKIGTVLLSSAFEAQALKQAPEQWKQFKDAYDKGDYQTATRVGTDLLGGITLPAAAVGVHAFMPEGKSLEVKLSNAYRDTKTSIADQIAQLESDPLVTGREVVGLNADGTPQYRDIIPSYQKQQQLANLKRMQLESPPVQEVVQAPAAPVIPEPPVLEAEKAAAKPETPTPQEEVTLQGQAEPVTEASQAPVESGLQAKPELPSTEVTIKASTSKGEPLEVKMDAREAEKVLNERKTALENLIDCLG